MMTESVSVVVEIAIPTMIARRVWYVFKEIEVKMSQDALGVQASIIRSTAGIIVSIDVSNKLIQYQFFACSCAIIVLCDHYHSNTNKLH